MLNLYMYFMTITVNVITFVSFNVHVYVESASGSVSEKTVVTPSNQRILKGNEEKVMNNFSDGQGSKGAPGNGYQVPINGNEQGLVGGHFNPHSTLHFISPQVSVEYATSTALILGSKVLISGRDVAILCSTGGPNLLNRYHWDWL